MVAVAAPDLGALRGLSKETLAAFNVRNNGTGWLWDTKCMDGSVGTRWKSYSSTPPEGDTNWKKYKWEPSKPATARYLVPVKGSLTRAIQDAFGTLYLVGGEIAAMSMIEAGYPNTTCTFGDNNIPDSLLQDLKTFGVSVLTLIPDRDTSGETWAGKIRQMLLEDFEIEIITLALPYPLTDKHGKDVNDFWLDISDKETFRARLKQLDAWKLPEITPKPQSMSVSDDDKEIPESLKADIRRLLGVHEEYNADGWSRRNVRCPFHDDRVASATWSNEKSILQCHGTCGRYYYARELCEYLGLRMGDYYRNEPTLSIVRNLPTTRVQEPLAPLSQQYSPSLSAFARLSEDQRYEAQHGRRWLDSYVHWASEAGPLSPDIFYEAMALWTLSMAATRRMKVSIGGENIYPNLYVFIVATTTVYRKSTALHLATSIIEQAKLDFLLMPERATPEALYEYLAGRAPMNYDKLSEREALYWAMGRTFAAQRAILEDEASGLLSEMKKDYMGGLSEILLKGYDGQGIKQKLLKSQGLITVKDMCLCFLGATTPVEWSRRMGQEERQNGFIARFAVITPDQAPAYRNADEHVPPPDDIVRQLRRLFVNTLPWDNRLMGEDGQPRALPIHAEVTPPPLANITIAPPAFEQISKYRKAMSYSMLKAAGEGGDIEEDKAASYARLGTMMIKVAMLLAAIDNETLPIRIEGRHAYAAQEICERWRESLHRLDMQVAASRYSGNDEKVLRFIRTSGEIGVTSRDLYRGCNLDAKEAGDILRTLQDAGLVEMFKRETTGKGRPAVCYRATN